MQTFNQSSQASSLEGFSSSSIEQNPLIELSGLLSLANRARLNNRETENRIIAEAVRQAKAP